MWPGSRRGRASGNRIDLPAGGEAKLRRVGEAEWVGVVSLRYAQRETSQELAVVASGQSRGPAVSYRGYNRMRVAICSLPRGEKEK